MDFVFIFLDVPPPPNDSISLIANIFSLCFSLNPSHGRTPMPLVNYAPYVLGGQICTFRQAARDSAVGSCKIDTHVL